MIVFPYFLFTVAPLLIGLVLFDIYNSFTGKDIVSSVKKEIDNMAVDKSIRLKK